MRIEARCRVHGLVAIGAYWTTVVMTATTHPCLDRASVQVLAVLTLEEWAKLQCDYKGWVAEDGSRTVLHLDADDTTILVRAEVR